MAKSTMRKIDVDRNRELDEAALAATSNVESMPKIEE
jgi:hypothetical protein